MRGIIKIGRLTAVLLIAVLTIGIVTVSLDDTEQVSAMVGDGSPGDPYIIESYSDLLTIGDASYYHYRLARDLDISTDISGNPGGWVPIALFHGYLDGDGHTISGFWTTSSYAGLIDYAWGNNTVIENLTIDVDGTHGVNGASYAGVVAARAENVPSAITIRNVHVTTSDASVNIVNASFIAGGLVGQLQTGNIIDCSFEGGVSAQGATSTNAGGLVGYAFMNNTISNSTARGNVTATSTTGTASDARAGGLVGRLSNVNYITDSTALYGEVTATSSGNAYAGGLMGHVEISINSITDSAATKTVKATTSGTSGAAYAGGIVGRFDNGSITDSDATGDVSSTGRNAYAGGFIGLSTITVTGSNATGDVSADTASSSLGTAYAGGFIGRHSTQQISNSYASGDVSATNGTYRYAGGFIGFSNGAITGSNATGDVSINTGPSGTSYAGGFIGRHETLQVSNSYASGDVSAINGISRYAGGFIGFSNGAITGSNATGDVSATTSTSTGVSYVGGFIGDHETLPVSNNYAAGDVAATNGASIYAGGFAGYSVNGTVSNNYAAGDVAATNGASTMYAGGFAGYLYNGTVSNNYALGDIEVFGPGSTTYAGGFIAQVRTSGINNSYSQGSVAVTGSITTTYIGGFVGHFYVGVSSVNNSYSTGIAEAAGTPTHIGGFIGDLGTSTTTISNTFYNVTVNTMGGVNSGNVANVTGKTVDELKTRDTFSGWDFSTCWGLYGSTGSDVGYGFPYISTIPNFILITPDIPASGYIYTDDSLPGYSADANYDAADHPLTGSLDYDPAMSNPITPGEYRILQGTLGIRTDQGSRYYQVSFTDGLELEVLAAPVPPLPPLPLADTITSYADSGSTITPSGSVTVPAGGSATFAFGTKSGYVLVDVIIDGISHPDFVDIETYTFTNVNEGHTINIISTYSPAGMVHIIVDVVGGNGAPEFHIGSSSKYTRFIRDQVVAVDSDVFISVDVADGYRFVNWTGETSSTNIEVHIQDITHDIYLVAHLDSDAASGEWSPINLIAAVLAIVAGITALIAGSSRSGEERSKTALALRIVSLIVGIVTVVVFFITEDLTGSVIPTDKWTLPIVILFLISLVVALVSFRFDREEY